MTFFISENSLKKDCIFTEPNVYTIPLTTTTLIGNLNPELNITIRIPSSVNEIQNFINSSKQSNISVILLHNDINKIKIDKQLLKILSSVNVINMNCENQIKVLSPITETINLNWYIDKCEELKNQIINIVNDINKFYIISSGESLYKINELNLNNNLTDLELKVDILSHELKVLKTNMDIHNALIKK